MAVRRRTLRVSRQLEISISVGYRRCPVPSFGHQIRHGCRVNALFLGSYDQREVKEEAESPIRKPLITPPKPIP